MTVNNVCMEFPGEKKEPNDKIQFAHLNSVQVKSCPKTSFMKARALFNKRLSDLFSICAGFIAKT